MQNACIPSEGHDLYKHHYPRNRYAKEKYSIVGRNIRNRRLLMFRMSLGGGGGLGEVRGHELEVEVGELLVLLQVQQARELAVSLDDVTVAGVLELVGANVGVES